MILIINFARILTLNFFVQRAYKKDIKNLFDIISVHKLIFNKKDSVKIGPKTVRVVGVENGTCSNFFSSPSANGAGAVPSDSTSMLINRIPGSLWLD